MKSFFTSKNTVLSIAMLTLFGLGWIQFNWIWQAYELKSDQIHRQLKDLTPKIAVVLEINEDFQEHKIIAGEEPLSIDTLSTEIDSILLAEGFFPPFYYAIFQEKEEGIFQSNTPDYREELRNSDYKTCLSCILTIQYVKDTINPVQPEMTFIRSISEMQKLPNAKPIDDYLWISLYVPNPAFLSIKAISGLFFLTVFLMSLLIALFWFTQRTLEKQKKLNQVKDDFFNNMTHEFKTPLGSILLASKVLRNKTLPEKKKAYLDLIEHESKKLEGQVDKILQLSLLENNRTLFEMESLNLHHLIHKVVQRLSLIVEEKGAKIQYDLNLTLPEVQIDENHFSNAIYNLVENALKYAGDFPKITIATFEKNNQKYISIKDNGRGIPIIHQEDIFDRFYRAQSNDQYRGKGFGIGLSYVKSVVLQHGGKIYINKEYKNGCEFIIVLGS